MTMKSVCVVEKSSNGKTGRVSATYAPFQTCPDMCPLKAVCYAKWGPCGLVTGKLTKNAKGLTREDLAQIEAEGIRELSGKSPLRLHVSGDCATDKCARTLGSACTDYRKKHRQPVWTYTHAWRTVRREAWGPSVSVLASCETLAQVAEARDREYATAMIVRELPKRSYKIGDVSFVPCKEQSKGIPCINCRLCFAEKTNRVILFESHGVKKRVLDDQLR